MVSATPRAVGAQGVAPHGVDLEESVLLAFDGGPTATLIATLRGATPGQARVFGADGWIDVLPRFHHPDTIVVHRHGHVPRDQFPASAAATTTSW